MPAPMTETARRQGLKNGLVLVAVFVILCQSLAAVLALVYGQGRFEAQRITLAVSWGLFLLIGAARFAYGRSIAGCLLLDCAPCPDRGFYIGAGVFYAIVTGIDLTLASNVSSTGECRFTFSLAAFVLVAAFARLQVRENGIMQYWSLLPWRRIASYRWTDDGTLLITKKRRLSLRVALPVPPEQKQAVNEFLTKFFPGQDAASVTGT